MFMKHILFVVALALAVVAYAGLAQAEPYISAYAGAVIPHDSDADGGEVGFDSGLAIGVKGGYWFTEQNAPYLGLELDVGASFPDMSEVTPPTTPVDADVTGIGVMVNALLRYPDGNLRPYGGVGLGWVFVDVDDGTVGGTPFTGDDDSAFGWQLLAGLDVMISPSASVFVEYRYLSTDVDFTFGGPGGGDLSIDYRASHVYGGLSYHF